MLSIKMENGNSEKEPNPNAVPMKRHQLLKWHGWGFDDSKFVVYNIGDKKVMEFKSNRYPIFQGQKLPYFPTFIEENLGADLSQLSKPQPMPSNDQIAPSNISADNWAELKELGIPCSKSGDDRWIRGKGQSMVEIVTIRESTFKRIPDVVIWPKCHKDVVKIVEFADAKKMVIIPYGGGTSVSKGLCCSENEKRTIISLDTSQMCKILWIDEDNLTACVEAGIVGQDLENALGARGYTCGHEPDSMEMSTLGGWVATRASGMKKNLYGNIEDIIVHIKLVTPTGVLEKSCNVPRLSCGPDFNHMVLGSEGTLGVITEVVLKIRPIPPCKKFNCFLFPNFDTGFDMVREIAKQKCFPASIRFADNAHFKFGYAMRSEEMFLQNFIASLKMFYVTKIKGYHPDELCVCTVLYEGLEEEVSAQEKKIHTIFKKFDALEISEYFGRRGYGLTFIIAYLRDVLLDCGLLSESFEPSVPWSRAKSLIRNVEHRFLKDAKKYNLKKHHISMRLTQSYDAGCVIYFYIGIARREVPNPLEVLRQMVSNACEEIVASGGCVSHHHGIGQMKRKWYPKMVSEVGLSILEATKERLDPNNVFACGNLNPKASQSKDGY